MNIRVFLVFFVYRFFKILKREEGRNKKLEAEVILGIFRGCFFIEGGFTDSVIKEVIFFRF